VRKYQKGRRLLGTPTWLKAIDNRKSAKVTGRAVVTILSSVEIF
jgi:hypothetical protein